MQTWGVWSLAQANVYPDLSSMPISKPLKDNFFLLDHRAIFSLFLFLFILYDWALGKHQLFVDFWGHKRQNCRKLPFQYRFFGAAGEAFMIAVTMDTIAVSPVQLHVCT